MAQPIRVLIADDSLRAREGLCALLTTWHLVEIVGQASNGQEALDPIAEHQPDNVLMDNQMPVMDGVQATLVVKHTWPNLTAIVLTMYATQQSAARAARVDEFVIKGSAPQRLLDVLETIIMVGDRSI